MVSEKRLIDANALMAEVKRTAEITKRRREQFSLRNLIMCIKNAPTVEVVHGRWEIIVDDYDCEMMMCSACRSEFYDGDNDTVDHTYNYCPNCGAKMDGDGNG